MFDCQKLKVCIAGQCTATERCNMEYTWNDSNSLFCLLVLIMIVAPRIWCQIKQYPSVDIIVSLFLSPFCRKNNVKRNSSLVTLGSERVC